MDDNAPNIEEQIEKFSATANRIADQRNDLIAAMRTLRSQLLPDVGAKGGLTPESRQRCMAIVQSALAEVGAK